MPYNTFYPGYSPYQYQPPVQPQQPVASFQTQTVIRVPSYDAVKGYNAEFGKPATFFDENIPFCYVKTAGSSPVEPPKTRIFELTERSEEELMKYIKGSDNSARNGDLSNVSEKGIDLSVYAKVDDIRALRAEYDVLKEKVDRLQLDANAVSDKSTLKMVQAARKDADNE